MPDKTPPETTSTTTQKTTTAGLEGVMLSVGVMWGLNTIGTFPIHAANTIATAAAQGGVPGSVARKRIYAGLGDAPKNNRLNFFAGSQQHWYKETARLVRGPALTYLLPYLKTQFSPESAFIIFAIMLSCYEMGINAFDAKKAKMGVGQIKPFPYFSKPSFEGSLGNGVRIAVSWWGYLKSTQKLDEELPTMGIDPKSILGMFLKAPFQSLTFTFLAYPAIEVPLRILQVSSEKYNPQSAFEVCRAWANYATGKTQRPQSVYVNVVADTVKTHGMRGLFFGFFAKFAVNAGLSLINNAVPVLTGTAKGYLEAWRRPK